MLVRVEDDDALRCVEAVYDGFDVGSGPAGAGAERVNVPGLRREQDELARSPRWDEALAGIEDEATAACVIAAAVLGRQTAAGGELDPEAWQMTCDGLLCDALLQARSPGVPGARPDWDARAW
jgi:hypothetical protein